MASRLKSRRRGTSARTERPQSFPKSSLKTVGNPPRKAPQKTPKVPKSPRKAPQHPHQPRAKLLRRPRSKLPKAPGAFANTLESPRSTPIWPRAKLLGSPRSKLPKAPGASASPLLRKPPQHSPHRPCARPFLKIPLRPAGVSPTYCPAPARAAGSGRSRPSSPAESASPAPACRQNAWRG